MQKIKLTIIAEKVLLLDDEETMSVTIEHKQFYLEDFIESISIVVELIHKALRNPFSFL